MMKRKIALILTFSLLICSLVGCTKPGESKDDGQSTEAETPVAEEVIPEITITEKLTEATSPIMDEIQHLDSEQVANYRTLYSVDDPDSDSWLSTEEGLQKLLGDYYFDYVSECASRITYTIDSVDEEALTVKLTCSYVNAAEYIPGILGYAASLLFSGSSSGDASQLETILKEASEKLSDKTAEGLAFKETEMVLTFAEAEDGYSLQSISSGFGDVMSCGLVSTIETEKDTLKENVKNGLHNFIDSIFGDSSDDSSDGN